jgi:uncharacterized protein YjdB
MHTQEGKQNGFAKSMLCARSRMRQWLASRRAPPFVLDGTPITLKANAAYHREATGGAPPYAYLSSNPAVATVIAGNGMVLAIKPGIALIRAEDGDRNWAYYQITVIDGSPAFSLPGTPVTLEIGDNYTRQASGGTPPYIYTSSSTVVATVDGNGRLTALRIGKTTITVRDQADGHGSYDVEAIDSAPPFYLDPSTRSMYLNENYTRTPTGGHPPYTYTSSNTAVATVDAHGLVTSHAIGSTTITVRDTRESSGSYIVTVSVAAPTLLAPTCSYVAGGVLDPTQVPAGGLPFTVNYATILVGDYIELTWNGATSGTVTKQVTTTGAQTLTLAKSYAEASTGRSVSVTYRVLRSGSWFGPSPALGFQVKVPPPTSLTEDFEGVNAGTYTPLRTGKLEVFQGGGQPITVGISNHPPHIVNKRAGAGLADFWVRFNQPCRKVTLGFVNPDQRIAIITCDTAQYQTGETIFEISGAARTVTLPEMPQGKPIGYLYIRRRSTTSQNPYPCNVVIDNIVMTLA